MRVELSNLDLRTFNRAKAQVDAAGIVHESFTGAHDTALWLDTESPNDAKRFVDVALRDPDARVMR